MRFRGLLLFLTLTLQLSAWARTPDFYEVSQPRRFKVTHTTVVTLPEGVDTLRVYHGIPDPAAWSGGGFRPERAVLTPFGCQVRSESNGFTWMWEHSHPTFTEQTFESRYHLQSADRRLRTELLHLDWSDFLPPAPGHTAPLGVAQLAAEVRQNTPIQSILELSSWTGKFSGYDGSVTHEVDDVAQTLSVGRGQCGHHAHLFAAVMRVWGIPCRIVWGLRLRATSELWTAQNDWNRHTWVEVMLPQVGWVEVEPRGGPDPFFQPAELIRTSGVQSHVTWIHKDGKWSVLETYQDRITAQEQLRNLNAHPPSPIGRWTHPVQANEAAYYSRCEGPCYGKSCALLYSSPWSSRPGPREKLYLRTPEATRWV